MKKYSVGFIGYGNMAQAITYALSSDISNRMLKSFGYKIKIAVSDPDVEKLKTAPERFARTTDNQSLIEACDIIFLAVKPQVAKSVLEGLDFTNKIVFSIMASVPICVINNLTGNKAKAIVRVMPNLNARVGASYTTFCTNGDEEIIRIAVALLSSFGQVKQIREEQMNISTGISGSGPAFVFKFINAFYKNAVKNGINKKTALEMALGTIIGSVNTVYARIDNDDVVLDELVDSVCSKGGTTIQGVNYLDESNFEDVVSTAIDKAIARAEEMSNEHKNG